MERYGDITSATFDQTALSGPISVRILRQAKSAPMGGDNDAFSTSIQMSRPAINIEVRIRDTSVADSLSLGQAGVLSIEIAPTRNGQNGRSVSITDAVLVGIEFQYEQSAPAAAKLTFTAQANEGNTDPFASQEAQP